MPTLNQFSVRLKSYQFATLLVRTLEKTKIKQVTDAKNPWIRHRYGAQIVLALLIGGLFTYGTVVLTVPPSPWNVLWMLVLPALLGILFNRGIGQLIMTFALPAASVVGTMVVGNAMGGM